MNNSEKPEIFGIYTAEKLWNDAHISKKMLDYHLNGDVDISSKKTEFIDRASVWIKDTFDLKPGKNIIDFGCGPGLYASRFARSGAKVTGVDFSENSIHYAKEDAKNASLDIDYICQNYLDFSSDKQFDLATMIMYDICALSPDQRNTLLGIFNKVLKPGGKVIFDVFSPNAFDKRSETSHTEKNLMDGFWSDEEYEGRMDVFKYEDEKVTLDRYIITKNSGTDVIYNWMQYFTPDSMKKELESSGFKNIQFFGNVAGDDFDEKSDEFAVIAEK